MVQWFKNLFHKKTVTEKAPALLEFNIVKLKTEMQNLSLRIGAVREDIGVVILEEVIRMAYNVQILEANRYKDEKSFWVHQGRLQALSDLSAYIEVAKSTKPEEELEKKVPRGVLKAHRSNNQAMASI